MDDFDRVELFQRDFLERFQGKQQISINSLTPPDPILEHMTGKTKKLTGQLKGLRGSPRIAAQRSEES